MSTFNLKNLESKKPEIKYCCAKQAIELSCVKPAALYPRMDVFVKLLDSENHILKWTAIIVIGNLSAADKQNKTNKLMPHLVKFLHEKEMITAANSIRALGQIAKNKPLFKKKIFSEFLKVEKAKYYNKGLLSPECRNIAIGHVLNVFDDFKDELSNRKNIISFIKRQTKNTRPAVKKRAIILLRRIRA